MAADCVEETTQAGGVCKPQPKSKTMTLTQVNSSAIRAVGHDGYTLTVEIHTRRTYDHPGVPYPVYQEFMNASSLGECYNRHIRCLLYTSRCV